MCDGAVLLIVMSSPYFEITRVYKKLMTPHAHILDAHAGYYADAREKGHHVELLITEALGGVHSGFVRMLRRLERD